MNAAEAANAIGIDITAASLRSTLDRMKEAQRLCGPPSYHQRLETLARLERALVVRRNAIADATSRDFGSRSRHESLFTEVLLVVEAIKHARANLRDWMTPEKRAVTWMFRPATVQVRRQPLGVVGIISPWNYPVHLALVPLVQVLAAGNRAMIKPSELVPATSIVLQDLVAEAFPEDQVAVVIGGPEVGDRFAHLPFDHLFFTGSTRVGRIVMQAASENLVPVTLELGGKSPTIVVRDFDLRTAAERILAGKLFNAGQTCVSPDYAMVPAASRDEFVESCRSAVAKMYPTLAKNPDYTSVVSDGHLARLRRYLQDARSAGANVIELTSAGEALDVGGRKLPPTLVLDVRDDMVIMQEEIFGPILPVRTYDSLEDVIAYVNAHPRPLALYVFSHNRRMIEQVLSQTVSGGVTVNDTMLHLAQADAPFGGVGFSGMGRYHGREGFDTFTNEKSILRRHRISPTDAVRPPYGRALEKLLQLLIGQGKALQSRAEEDP